jgi:hypothetical protein
MIDISLSFAAQIVNLLSNGARLEVPPVSQLRGGGFAEMGRYIMLMRSCWDGIPESRPGFDSIVKELAWLLTAEVGP